jgi:hypothetical protein
MNFFVFRKSLDSLHGVHSASNSPRVSPKVSPKAMAKGKKKNSSQQKSNNSSDTQKNTLESHGFQKKAGTGSSDHNNSKTDILKHAIAIDVTSPEKDASFPSNAATVGSNSAPPAFQSPLVQHELTYPEQNEMNFNDPDCVIPGHSPLGRGKDEQPVSYQEVYKNVASPFVAQMDSTASMETETEKVMRIELIE